MLPENHLHCPFLCPRILIRLKIDRKSENLRILKTNTLGSAFGFQIRTNSNWFSRVPFSILCAPLVRNTVSKGSNRAMFFRSPPSRSLPEAKVGGPTKETPRERSARMPVAVARYERRDRHVRAERARRFRTGPGDLGRRQTRGATGESRVVFHIRSRI